MNKFRLILAIIVMTTAATAYADSSGPWSVNSDAPVLLSHTDRERPHRPPAATPAPSLAATPFHWLLRFYQKLISPLDGDRCPMYPTCSQYSVLAIRKHGPVLGIVMTTDRLLHEADEQVLGPRKTVGDRQRTLDPVENNDYWWMK